MKSLTCYIVLIVMLLSATSHQLKYQSVYSEKFRPQYHFSPQKGWMNDPNGLVYFAGEYHLFYQYYPDSTVWGPMHWAHAISRDLVYWENFPVALYPDSIGYIFSGSAVVDWKNSSGFGSVKNPPMIAMFTYHNMERERKGRIDCENQGIAYSTDKGRTWAKYAGNPVLINPGVKDFRDPKVIWHEQTRQWNVILSAHDRVKIYSSPDLKNWKYESEFGMNAGSHGGVWECPDLFPIKENGTGQAKWVLLVNMNPGGPNGGSGTQYFVGEFDGHNFIPASLKTSWLDYGRDNYAGVTWSDIPREDGRRLFIGWMSNWNYAQVVPTFPWRSAMTLPRELLLIRDAGTFQVKSVPVKESKKLVNTTSTIAYNRIKINNEVKLDTKGINLNQCKLTFNLECQDSTPESLGLQLENATGETLKISYSYKDQQFSSDRTGSGKMKFAKNFTGIDKAPYHAGKQLQLQLFLDAASMELFVDGGKLVMTDLFFLSGNFNSLKIFTSGGEISLLDGEISNLQGIWH